MKYWLLHFIFLCVFISGCHSSGNLGLVTKSSANPGELLKSGKGYEEIGPAEGQACRHFVLAIIPWGKSDFPAAVDQALRKSGGDALINVSVESSLYGFVPIYNVYSYTCTTVKGIAIKLN